MEAHQTSNLGVLGSSPSRVVFFFFLDYIAFEILAYADDLCVLCRDKNELLSAIKRIDKWSIENGINVNRKKWNFCNKR